MANEVPSVEILAKHLYDIGFKYTWNIEDYLKGLDGDVDVDSPTFGVYVNGLHTKWSLGLRYWTDDSGLRLTNPVLICLNLVSAFASNNGIDICEELQVRFQFGIWNNAVKQYEVCPIGSKTVDVKDQGNQCMQSVGTRDIMILDRHLVGKSIEMFCKIMLIREQRDENNLAMDLWSTLTSGENCDVKIQTTDGNTIPVHKTILLCRSSTFKNLIDKNDTIKLNISTSMLTSLLQYIYTDRVDPLENPQNLLKFAVQLELPGLKQLCEKALLDSITPANIASILLIADTFECEALKKAALAFCEENAHSIVKTVAWKIMEEVNPKLFEEVSQQF